MGKLFVIDGLDGSGKATQTKLLFDYFSSIGKNALKITFPNYEEQSSALVKMYLSGEISNNPSDINAYACSSFYACDRYISFKKNWEKDYKTDSIIIADRYVSSNLIHQMVKLPPEQWDEFIDWLDDLEFNKFGLPKPDKIIYLDVLPSVSKRLITERYNGDEQKRDIHESDFLYLESCRNAALYVAKKLKWHIINCCENDTLFSREQIFEKIKEVVC